MSNTEAKYDNKDNIGISKDLYKAWYQKAVENGNIKAQYDLAELYYKGEGTEKNLEKALLLVSKSSRKWTN